MTQKTTCLVALALILLSAAPRLEAQMKPWTEKGFIEVNVGLQEGGSFTENTSPLIYGEPSVISVSHNVSNGPTFDASGGFRVWKNFGIGVGYSYFSTSQGAAVLDAQVPNPIVFESLRPASATIGPLSHTESVVHVQLLWMFPLSDKFRLAAIVGPSIFMVKQDLVSGLNLTEGQPLFDSVTIQSAETQEQSKTTFAVTVGGDASYFFSKQFGVGLFARYSRLSGGNADVPTPDGTSTVGVTAGGFQGGVGLRVRF